MSYAVTSNDDEEEASTVVERSDTYNSFWLHDTSSKRLESWIRFTIASVLGEKRANENRAGRFSAVLKYWDRSPDVVKLLLAHVTNAGLKRLSFPH